MAYAMYDPSSVYVFLAGLMQLEDVTDGTFIEVTKDSDLFSNTVTSDGKVYRMKIPGDTYTVTLSLQSVSKSSKVLQYLMIADQTTGVAKFPLIIKDTSGSSLFFATSCWVQSQPTLSFADNVEARVWTLKATGVTISFGDSYGASSTEEDILNGVIGSLPSLAGLL